MSDPYKLTLLLRQRPLGTSHARDALDIALAGGAFCERMAVVFMNAGVLQLRKGLDGSELGLHNFSANLTALPHYGVEHLFVHQGSLLKHGLQAEQLALQCQLLDDKALQSLLNSSEKVLAL